MTENTDPERNQPSPGPAPDWETLARYEIAASMQRSHRMLYETVADLADEIAHGRDIPYHRIVEIRTQYLECEERLSVALHQIGVIDRRTPAEQLNTTRRRFDRNVLDVSTTVSESEHCDIDVESILSTCLEDPNE